MSESAEVIVIGAGVQGASLAFALAKRGVDVLVLERRDGRLPPLSEVREAVEYQWRRDLERRVLDAQYEGLAGKYRVVIEAVP